MAKNAYDRFVASLTMDFEKWHDGVGYDLQALGEMSAEERSDVVMMMASRDLTWREVEVLAAIGGAKARKVLERAAKSGDRQTRIAAEEALAGDVWDAAADQKLCAEIRGLTTIQEGLTSALLAAEEHPSAGVKEALLEAAGKKTEAAIHCAALLCYLCGKADEAFDWKHRPFYLKFVVGASDEVRAAAYKELQERVGMKVKPSVWDWLKK